MIPANIPFTKNKKAIILSLLTILIMVSAQSTDASALNTNPGKTQESSVVTSQYTTHDPITITGNSDFHSQASSEGWPGSGTSSDPYIIEDLSISASGTDEALIIENTDLYYVFRNNLLDGSSPFCYSGDCNNGVYISSATHGVIEGNIIKNFERGILASSSQNITILQNTIYSNTMGIRGHFSDFIEIVDNEISDHNEYGIWLRASNNNTIDSNTIYQNLYEGIRIDYDSVYPYTYYSFNNSITNNWIHDNGGNIFTLNADDSIIKNNTIFSSNDGIISSGDNAIITENTIFDTNNAIRSSRHNATIFGNYVYNNTDGIFLNSAHNNTVFDNHLQQNENGLTIWRSDFAEIIGNQIYDSNFLGVKIYNSENSTIESNVIYNNIEGIRVQGISANNTIVQNEVYNNLRIGIHLGYTDNPDVWSADNNTVVSNTVVQNNIGIFLNITASSYVYRNSVKNNSQEGIGMGVKANSNTVELNTVEINDDYGLSTNGSENNILRNDFMSNGNFESQAQDSGINNTFSKNYWNDHNNLDEDLDGFADNHYNITGSANNTDSNPAALANSIHSLLPPELLYPVGGEILSSIVEITWSQAFDNFGHEIVYSIFISSDQGSSWIEIVSDLTTTSYEWNTTLHTNDDYLIKIQARDNQGLTSESQISTEITLANHYMEAPVITNPDNGDTIGGDFSIRWIEAEDSLNHQITYTLYYSGNAGETWSLLVEDISDTTFSWDTTSVPNGDTYKLWIVAYDGEGLTVESRMDGVFSIDQSVIENPEDDDNNSLLGNLTFNYIFFLTGLILMTKFIRKTNEK